MMADFLLHEGAEVQCLHTGKATPNVTNLRVKVSGKRIVTMDTPYTIAPGCTLPSPPAGNGPCASAALWVKAATRVRAGGKPVLLKSSQATCAPSGTGVKILSTQTRVKGT